MYNLQSRAVLWDLDGTLVDSTELHWIAWRDTMAAEGVPITREMFEATFGWKNDPILRKWLGEDAADDRTRRIADVKERSYRDALGAQGLQPLPGAKRWVDALHRDGWKQAIASSAPLANIEAVLRVLDIGHEFEAIVSGDDVTAGKPDPRVFLLAAEKLGVAPARAIVVEDAEAGIEGARRAGMKSIGVNPKLKLAADVYVRNLDELEPDAFERLTA